MEDDGSVRMVARIALETHGVKGLPAGRGAEALRLAGEYVGPIHVPLTDVVMPEMDGR